jgi:ABC-2 type transport system permease protein
MSDSFLRIQAVTGRVLNQLQRDRRQIALSLIFPLVIIYFIKILFDALASPFFDASRYVVPYGGFLVHFITFLVTAIVLVEERTQGTLDRMFVSGYGRLEIIGGYLIAYSVLATLQSLLILLELSLLFTLDYSLGQFASIYLIMWLLATISLVLGLLVSNFCRTVGQVLPFFPLILISMIVSGVLIPFDQLPGWVQVLSYLSPLFYANEVLQVLIVGGGLLEKWGMLASLPAYGLVLLAAAMLTLRELD